jgi:WD40 repeat protein
MKSHKQIRTTIVPWAIVLAMAALSRGQEPKEEVDTDAKPLPQGVVARIVPEDRERVAAVRGLAASADGSQIAVFDPTRDDAELTILDGQTGKTLATIERTGASVVQQVAFSRDGRFAAATQAQRGLLHWNMANPKSRLELTLANPGRYVAAASSSAELGALGELTGEITVGPLVSPEIGVFSHIKQWQAHSGAVTELRFSADGKRLASCGRDRSVAVWEPHTGKQLFKQTFERKPLDCLALSADGGKVALVVDGELQVWDVNESEKLIGGEVAGDPVTAIEFTADGRSIAVGDGAGMLRTYDAATLKLARETTAHQSPVTALLASPLENTVVSGGDDSIVHAWDAATLEKRRSFYPNRSPIVDLAFSADGKRLAAATERLGGWCWDFDNPGKPLVGGWGINLRLLTVGFANQGNDLAKITDRRLYLRASVGPRRPEAPRTLPPKRGPVQYFEPRSLPTSAANGLAFSPDGRFVVASIGEGIGRWEVTTAVLRDVFPIEPNIRHAMAISPDGRWMAAGGAEIALWDLNAKKLIARLGPQETGQVLSLAFSPDSQRLAAGGPSECRVWNLATRRTTASIPTGMVKLGNLGFTADGFCLVTLSPPTVSDPGITLDSLLEGQKRVAVWEIVSGGLRYELPHPPGLASGFLADDQTTIYTGSTDGTIHRWNLAALLDEAEKPASEPASIDQLWRDLASQDARVAYRAIRGLAALGQQAVTHLANSLESAGASDADLDELIADLASPRAQAQREASKRLRSAGATAVPKLQKALAANPSPTVRARLELLLAAPVDGPSRELIRAVRAVQALARIDTDAARQTLVRLTDGPEGAPVSDAARAALAARKQANK